MLELEPELVELVLDEGTFESWDAPLDLSGHPEAYQAELRAAAEKAGTDESVVTGFGVVRGRPVAFVINEFRFLGGTIGRAAADRIVAVRQGNLLATSFHPEVTGDRRVHELFVQMVRSAA